MKRLVIAMAVSLGGLAAVWAQNAGRVSVLEGRPEAWRKQAAVAASDATKAADAVRQMAVNDRAAFAADVLALVQTKPAVDKAAGLRDFAATAGALATGAGGAEKAVVAAVADAAVGAGATDTRAFAVSADTAELLQATMGQMPAADRALFATGVIQSVERRKFADENARKLAVSAASLALVAGAGEKKAEVIAAVFCTAPTTDLGAVAAVLSDGFSQRKNSLSNEDYLLAATRILQAVADCTAGRPDGMQRFGYAVAAFINASVAPATFEPLLMAKVTEMLSKGGQPTDGLAAAVAAAKADLTANGALVAQLHRGIGKNPVWGVIILPFGTMLAGEEGPPFVHENRPPGYQNQGIGVTGVR